MTWIRFDPEEPSAPLHRLLALPGVSPQLQQLYGRANMLIYFAHGLDCPACRAAIDELAANAGEFLGRETALIVVTPQGDPTQASEIFPLHLLVDANGAARAQLGDLLELDTTGQRLLVILNVYAAPSAAWVGDDPRPEDELLKRSLQRLDYISIQCPE